MINGVQKLASAVISSANSKTRKAVFAWLFLLLVAGQLFHNLSTKRCSNQLTLGISSKNGKI
ncbi:hydrolase [Enterococcus faecium]|nr:hydrolase [Enterococcus faecium]